MLRRLTLPLALGTVIVCGMERVDLGDGFRDTWAWITTNVCSLSRMR
jgi:hypothetical protein